MLIRLERLEKTIRDVLLQHVLEIATRINKEGIIAIGPLECNGNLGPDEEKVIRRLSFLIHAYTVQSWYVWMCVCVCVFVRLRTYVCIYTSFCTALCVCAFALPCRR